MLLLVLTAGITGSSYACTCIGKDKQTTESEFSSSKLVVKGKIIASTDYLYYDTLITLFTGIPFDRATSGYMIRQYKIYTLVVESRFKSDKGLADTLRIVTGYGNGDCGYEFETGKDYPIYSRKKGSLTAEEEILFDCNELAKGKSFFQLGGMSISPDNKFVVYSTDFVGRRIYTLQIKNLETRALPCIFKQRIKYMS